MRESLFAPSVVLVTPTPHECNQASPLCEAHGPELLQGPALSSRASCVSEPWPGSSLEEEEEGKGELDEKRGVLASTESVVLRHRDAPGC